MPERMMAMREVVFLHTDWCGPCRFMLEQSIGPLKEERPEQVRIENITNYSPLVKRFRPTRVPTLVFLEDGEEFYRVERAVDREFIERVLDE